jgi:hypothetical protein
MVRHLVQELLYLYWHDYICGYIKSLGSGCIGIQTSIKALYIPFQVIIPFAVLSKSNDTAISLVLRGIKKGVLPAVIRSGGIR